MPRLTLRKVTVLLWLESGTPYKEIARELGICEQGVRGHVLGIARKLPARPGMTPRDVVLLYCERLLAANADAVATVRALRARSA